MFSDSILVQAVKCLFTLTFLLLLCNCGLLALWFLVEMAFRLNDLTKVRNRSKLHVSAWPKPSVALGDLRLRSVTLAGLLTPTTRQRSALRWTRERDLRWFEISDCFSDQGYGVTFHPLSLYSTSRQPHGHHIGHINFELCHQLSYGICLALHLALHRAGLALHPTFLFGDLFGPSRRKAVEIKLWYRRDFVVFLTRRKDWVCRNLGHCTCMHGVRFSKHFCQWTRHGNIRRSVFDFGLRGLENEQVLIGLFELTKCCLQVLVFTRLLL